MASRRMNIRLPEQMQAELEEKARTAGFSSACALARCVLCQFVRYTPAGAVPLSREWLDDMVYDESDRMNPTRRKEINERR